MNNLYTHKGKFLLLGFAGVSFCYAITGAALLFAGKDSEKSLDESGKNMVQEPVQVVVLKDGAETKFMAVEDFLKVASNNPDLSPDDIAKVVKLKNEVDLGKAQIDLFKKLTEKKEEPFFSGAIKQGVADFKGTVKGLLKPVISTITNCAIIAGVTVAVFWYFGGVGYHAPLAGRDDFKPVINPQGNIKTNYLPKDYTHKDSNGVLYSDKELLCNYDGWVYNMLGIRPNDCPQN